METGIINITEEQRQNLVNEIATLIAKFKDNQQVECIYFSGYKGLSPIRGRVLELVIVTRGNSEKISNGFIKYNGLHLEHRYIRDFGLKIHVMFDDARKYTNLPLNPSEIIRANSLFNSIILLDKTGEYFKIQQIAQEYANVENSNIFQYENSAEIYPPIDELIKTRIATNKAHSKKLSS